MAVEERAGLGPAFEGVYESLGVFNPWFNWLALPLGTG